MNTKLLLSIREQIEKSKVKRNKYVIAFDLDETLWDFVPMDSDEEPKPIWDNIAVVNELFKDDSLAIVLYTSRRVEDFFETTSLLEKYGVKYHSLQFGKMKFDVLVDDKSVNPTA
ncbi:hypothetical protein A2442_00905 [Candidatus Campbellbacteria bacterium RIFOXYC2_FULL_35_25]|uniref:FCP1 homology domain-containing protein n=1 Tax=Candidatus Campbellbacteria bacterium RIFOXYC2_FULL_35_25 TaxID=1797582 RepID=A0A1F5EIV0_9BACT|nr:MAG: hypothetical protein A2442_00905 [Candidatus Campbellbacteria bacterium RIFOXYC2_FULL_35_25]